MIYREKKLKSGYEYRCTDVFGHIRIKSPEPLKGSILDDIFDAVFKSSKGVATRYIKGKIEDIDYLLIRKNIWKA